MRMITATATEMQNNFGHYLNFVMSVQESIVTKNGKEAGRFTSKEIAVFTLADSLTGITLESLMYNFNDIELGTIRKSAKPDESLGRKATGPVKWQPVA